MLNMADIGADSPAQLAENLSDMVDGLVNQFKLGNVARPSAPGKYLGNFFKALAAEKGPFVVRSEADAKRHFRLFMEMLGAKVQSEKPSLLGYADAIVETKKFVWVFEFKFNKSAKAAVRQIRDKGYADQYKGDKRPVTLVGINFRNSKRNIDEPLFAAL